jgi:hypothetical protein
MPLQQPWIKKSRRAEEERTLARRKIKPWQRQEDSE